MPGPPLLPFMQWTEATSLAGRTRSRSLVARPTTWEQCRQVLDWCRHAGVTLCADGSGRGGGDAALDDGQVLLDVGGMNRILDFDYETGQITVEGGVRLIDVFREVHHRLLTLPACPSDSQASVAGAISAHVDGQDGWRHGSFARQVVRMTVLLADGRTVVVGRGDELFNSIVGGIGLIGVVLDATLELQPIPSPFVEIERIPAANADALLATLAEVERTHDALVAWVDARAQGDRTGRSVVQAARWIERDESAAERKRHLEACYARLERHRRLVPRLAPMLQAPHALAHAFNRLYYAACELRHRGGRSSNDELFLRFAFEARFPVPPAHLACGPRGHTLRLVFPRRQLREALIELLGVCRQSPCPPVTTVLRVHGRDDGLLALAEDGYDVTLAFHPRARHAAGRRAATDRLIEATIRRGGRTRLAGEPVLTPDSFHRMYPRAPEFLALKRRLDPEGLFSSDLARRVGLDDGPRRAPRPRRAEAAGG